MESTYLLTNNWFDNVGRSTWQNLLPQIKPQKILEVGAYEGASTCFLIEECTKYQSIEIHCIDNWEGGIEAKSGGMAEADMNAVEERFTHNIKLASERVLDKLELFIHKGFSDVQLAKLLAEGKNNYFDFIYIDGSHQAPDVLCDAVLGFRLLKLGGVIAFDDYLWAEPLAYGIDLVRCPKLAIDSFVNIYCRKVNILPVSVRQMYMQKVAD